MEAVRTKKRKTPSKSKISKQPNNDVVPCFPNYITKEERLESFEKWPIPEIKTPLELAQVGFFYSGDEDLVQCFSCGGGLSNWKICVDAAFEHAKYYPACNYIIEKKGKDFVEEVKKKVKDQYKAEQSRLSSFDDFWPESATKTPKQLARAGFINTGDIDDEVQCFECGITIMNWKADDDVWFKHTQSNPKCEFVFDVKGPEFTDKASQVESPTEETSFLEEFMKEQTRDLDHPCHDNYKNIEQRMQTFKNWPIPQIQKPEELAAAGLFYSEFDNWRVTEVASEKHAKWYPLCAFIRQLKGEAFVETVKKKLRNNFKIEVAGKKSYKTWPSAAAAYKDPQELYEAGFFYSANEDAVQCFDCGSWYSNWQVEDDPWFIHAKLNSSCEFLRRMRGESFLNQVEQVLASRKKASKRTLSVDESAFRTDIKDVPELMKFSIVQTVLKVGFNESRIEIALRYYLKCPESCRTVDNLFALIMLSQKKDPKVSACIENLKKENDRCSKAKACKFCFKLGPISILVPCTHLLSCCSCIAKNLKRCFACDKEIEHKLEMFPNDENFV